MAIFVCSSTGGSLASDACHTVPYLRRIVILNLVHRLKPTADRCFFASRRRLAVPVSRSLVYLVESREKMVSHLTPNQLRSLETVERVASCFSLVGTVFIFVTFLSSSNFRKPINRLIFAASWGNTVCNIATLLSQSGIRAGQGSHLCQFQGFLIQM